jgi:hypothetical protein
LGSEATDGVEENICVAILFTILEKNYPRRRSLFLEKN